MQCVGDSLIHVGNWVGFFKTQSWSYEKVKWSEFLFHHKKLFSLWQRGDVKEGVAQLAAIRTRWLTGGYYLIRAARHYEGAAQILIRRAVASANQFIVLEPKGELPAIGRLVHAAFLFDMVLKLFFSILKWIVRCIQGWKLQVCILWLNMSTVCTVCM